MCPGNLSWRRYCCDQDQRTGCIADTGQDFFPTDKNADILSRKGYSVLHGEIRDKDEVIDEVLVSLFRARIPIQARIQPKFPVTAHPISFRGFWIFS
jgi:hypothetical protein